MISMFLFLVNRVPAEPERSSFNAFDPGPVHLAVYNSLIIYLLLCLHPVVPHLDFAL